jgi:hypothetical protein
MQQTRTSEATNPDQLNRRTDNVVIEVISEAAAPAFLAAALAAADIERCATTSMIKTQASQHTSKQGSLKYPPPPPGGPWPCGRPQEQRAPEKLCPPPKPLKPPPPRSKYTPPAPG